jgi:hypothetical protein
VGDYFVANHVPSSPESFVTQKDLDWWPDYLRATTWIREHTEDEPWSRVGGFGHPHDHVLTTLPMYTGAPVFTGESVPGHTYRYFFHGHQDRETLRAVGVRYVLANPGWASGRDQVALRAEFGRIHIYELTDAQPTVASPMGECTVQPVRTQDDEVLLAILDVQEPCRIRIHRSDFPNWRATMGGQDLAIERAPTHEGSDYSAFMSVLVPESGLLELRWEHTRGDRFGAWISVVAWLVFGFLVLLWTRPAVYAFLRERAPVFSPALRRGGTRLVWGVTVVSLCLVVVAGVSRSQERRYTLDRHLDDAEKVVQVGDERQPCKEARRGPGWRCGQDWDLVRGGLFSFGYDNRYCVYAHPSPRGPKHVRFADVPLGERLSGFYGLLDTSQGPGKVHMEVTIDEGPPLRFTAQEVGAAVGFEVKTTPGTAAVQFTITADRPDWRHFCFNAQVLDH